jgi:hypothetical protein
VKPYAHPQPEKAIKHFIYGVVHANVGQNVTPHKPFLRVVFVPFSTYNELGTSQVNPQQHKQPTIITTMVMAPLAPPAAWI